MIVNEIINKEGYSLDISEDGIEIRASSSHGAFYAVQSLRQLLPPDFDKKVQHKRYVE